MSLITTRMYAKNLRRIKGVLNRYVKGVRNNTLEAAQSLAEDAADEAQARYDDYMGEDGNTVDVIGPFPLKVGAVQEGFYIKASGIPVRDANGNKVGNTVVFEEFGSGVGVGSHPSNDFPDLNYAGSWSESPYGTGEFAETGMWHYKGKEYVYIPATYAMYLAGQLVRDEAKRLMQEAFR